MKVDGDDVISNLRELDYKLVLSYWIKSENDLSKFYKELACKSKEVGLEEWAFDMFILLSEESKRVEKKLKEIYSRKFGSIDIEKLPDSPIKIPAYIKEFDNPHSILGILKSAIYCEELAENICQVLSQKAPTEYEKELFKYLASSERCHLRILTERFNYYKKKLKAES
ncbi:ferritin-like domain-containing protein [Thermococcus barophilus]|uniref:ferritin-like domain-containing protein n=1 Tax=Thermococcus barophilus TaxID=55802 RepID=UPI0011D142DB|nr:ferritin family protein [Thermococcus barophilus]